MRQYTRISLEDRFWSKVAITANDNKCWLWLGAKDPHGYGRINSGGKNGRALVTSRVVWELVNGNIPNGLDVCHHCDNPSCVNPKHLFLGTALDNARDMVKKGRHVPVHLPGEKSGNNKLTAIQVRQIRERYAAGGISQRQLAREYGITQPQIGHIVRRMQWKEEDDGG